MNGSIITNLLQYAITVVALFSATLCVHADDTVNRDEPIRALPSTLSLDPEKVAIGRSLFHDRRLSRDGNTACADCHRLDQGGTSGRITDRSHNGQGYQINTPTIYNTAYNFRQNWDGSASDLNTQLRRMLHDGESYLLNIEPIIELLRTDNQIANDFSRVYRNGLSEATLIDSLVLYQRSLTTPGSRFDRYISGDSEALTEEEIAGYELFKNIGCVSCHQGVNIGGNLYQKFGVFYDYIAERGNSIPADSGRLLLTGRSKDENVFKVPSLRNVAQTSPYLHDGSAATLDEAIYIIGRTQLGRKLDASQISLLKSFLNTLTGEYENHLLRDERS